MTRSRKSLASRGLRFLFHLVTLSPCHLVTLSPCLLVSFGCHRDVPNATIEPPAPPWFEDVTERVGLHFVHDAGPTGSYFFPQILGSGAALFDFDNDGRLDIYLLQNGGPDSASTNRLFRQEVDGRFTDVTAGSGLDVAGY